MTILMSVNDYLDGTPFFLDVGIAVLLFSAPLTKREKFAPRFAAVVVIYLLLAQISYRSIPFYLLYIAAVAGLLCIPYHITWPNAVFCVACAYATEHCATALDAAAYIYAIRFNVPHVVLRYLIVFPVVYLLTYFLVARNLSITESSEQRLPGLYSLASAATLVLPAVILSDLCGRHFGMDPDGIYCQLYDALCCILFLSLQVIQSKRIREQIDFHVQNQILRQAKEQLQISGQSIDLINHRCHDLKYRIECLRSSDNAATLDHELGEISHAVQIYNAVVNTGNEALDTILSERGLYCEANQITLTCVTDGKLLCFMDAVDIYCLFGNAIDNAIEYVRTLKDPEKRLISVALWQKGGLVLAQVENYCEQVVPLRNGLPVTTKPDAENHGFGTGSMRSITEKYSGYMEIESLPPRFSVTFSFPYAR